MTRPQEPQALGSTSSFIRRPVVDVANLPPSWALDAAAIRLTPIQAAEADTIAKALCANRGNKAAAASELGISRSSLYRKIEAYRLR